ncbi:MAG: hypothetical protein LKF82_00745 [Acinetobacter populi]|jgi:hypothetical protein|uniref:hypothetical protein n=1 Tax=Acinetobacter populi TaxID=1582270 RepID=UPI0023541C80|nr:hypothetical protein [Acinetobacter populi]MCH4246358.1 hypothetical protein [Acinetobacter populi]
MILKKNKSPLPNQLQLVIVKTVALFLFIFSPLCSTSIFAETLQQPKTMYYRYYDNNGVATVSKNVSPTHIRRGYEALDRNMAVIYKVPAYSVEADLKQERTRAVQSEEARKDQVLKRSYRNVAYATQKKTEALAVLQKQINQQYQQMRQLQTDRGNYLKQRSNYILDKKPVPAQLQKTLDNNALHIKNTRNTIEQLKSTYVKQEQQFDYIISRLQRME